MTGAQSFLLLARNSSIFSGYLETARGQESGNGALLAQVEWNATLSKSGVLV